jgi:hypothetical protein
MPYHESHMESPSLVRRQKQELLRRSLGWRLYWGFCRKHKAQQSEQFRNSDFE